MFLPAVILLGEYMSISVVPAAAAAARAKQIGHKKKPVKKPEDEQVAQNDEKATDADKAELHDSRSTDHTDTPPGPGGEAFRAALVEAAALQGADSAEAPAGYEAVEDDSDDGDRTPLLIGGAVLIGGGIAAIAAGGGGGGGGSKANSAPAFAAATQAVTTAEDAPLVITSAATDADSDTLTYTNTNPTKGTVTRSADGKYTYTPNADFNGTDTFTVTASDGKGGTATQTINITITPVNDAPTAPATNSATTAEDAAVTVSIGAADVDGDALTYTAAGAANGKVTFAEGGKAIYTPNANFNGTDSFTVTVSDGKGGTATQTVNITVTPVNDPPVVAATQTVAGTEDTPLAITVNATDVDGDVLTYTPAGASNGKVEVGLGGKLTYTPNANFNGTDTFTVTVSDGNGGTATQTVTVNIAAAPETVSIDVGDNVNAVTFNASGDDFLYTDDSAKTTNVIINSLAVGDRIQATGASSDYNFTSVGNDIQISFNNTGAGVLNTIVLPGLAAGGGFVFDEVTAEAVAGFDFFNALTLPGGNGSADGIAALDGNLDDDDDANVLTQATTSGAGGDLTFTESALIANNIAITEFTAGDRILVSGAPTSAYSFATSGANGEDIQIVFNNNGVISQIVLTGANASGATITNEAQAEAVIGSDFFQVAPPTTPGTNQAIDNGSVLQTLDASAESINFTDNALVSTNVIITGFTANDLITVTGRNATDYNFTTDDNQDLKISYTTDDASASNSIVLDNVIVNAGFISNYDQAVQAVGYNFINFA